MKHVDVIVVGGGIMGCAAAAALSRAGARTVLLEAARIGHTEGSSHGRSRIIRLAYGAADYIELCRSAYAAWRALEDEAGEILCYTTGGLDFAAPGVATWQNTRAAMAAAGVVFEELDIDEVRRRFPQFNLPQEVRALYQPEAGVLHADACLAALTAVARRHGAELIEGASVTSIAANSRGVHVEAGALKIGADRLVIAAGSRINEILSMVEAELPLTISTEQVAYFRPRNTAEFVAGRLPLFITHFPDGRLGSGFPLIRDPGLKLMLENKGPRKLHRDGTEVPPDHTRIETLRRHALELLPELTGEILGSITCRYTLTPDEDFVLDRLPSNPRIVVASACSGHGFKFGALFGQAMAELALERTPSIDLSRFRMSRFRGSTPSLAMA